VGRFLLSPEKVEVFKKLWMAGIKEHEIARVLGIHVSMVPVYAKILGLPPRKKKATPNKKIRDEDIEFIREMWVNGATIKEIAEYFGVSERTITDYLRAMGLRRREERKCPDIPREELEKLCFEGHTDKEIARLFHTSKYCIAKLRQKYGINKRELAKRRHEEKLHEIIDKIVAILNEKGYTTSTELRDKYGIIIHRKLLQHLESAIDGFRWFKLKYTSTYRYSVFPPKFNGVIVMYLKGEEAKVILFLCKNIVSDDTPITALKRILKINNAPDELINLFKNTYDSTSSAVQIRRISEVHRSENSSIYIHNNN